MSEEREYNDDEMPLSDDERAQRIAEAELRKAAAEAMMAELRLKQMTREEAEAERAAKSLAGHYWFVPTPRQVLQAFGAGLLVAAAFSFLYEPIATLKANKAELGAEIEGRKAELQRQANDELSKELDVQKALLEFQKQKLKGHETRYTAELEALVKEFKSNQKAKDSIVQLTQSLQTQLSQLSSDYRVVAQKSETEKERFNKLAEEAAQQAKQLEAQVSELQKEAQAAGRDVARVQRDVETRPGRVFRDALKSGGEGPQMVNIASGSFMMGSPPTERGRDNNEGPQHKVTITEPFAMSVHEITFAEYDACVEAGGCNHRPEDRGRGRGQLPVINVSWNAAQAYVTWLSNETGHDYRLPTEAEWEYAARADSTTAYSFGDGPTPLDDYAWYKANAGGKTHPVGTRKANGWGLYDMHGNVWEWVQDWYKKDYYHSSPEGDPQGPDAGAERVIRGGSWTNSAQHVRTAFRVGFQPVYQFDGLGFRCVRIQDVSK